MSLESVVGVASLLIALFLLPAGVVKAECLSTIKGLIVTDVMSCAQVKPEKVFNPSKGRYSWIQGLDPAGKKKLMQQYRGVLVRGLVVKSEAVNIGLSKEKGALSDQTVYLFLPPSKTVCSELKGKRVAGQVTQACCDGGGDVPCLLDVEYLFTDIKVIGSSKSGAGDAARLRASRSKDYQKATRAYQRKDYRTAVKFFERSRTEGSLDLRGNYKLGRSYRELDLCRRAIVPLKDIYDKSRKGKVWADEAKIAREAVFLLARCYSKMNKPDLTVEILNGYLLEPKKYRSEIRRSLRHRDFGWIHTSKAYREYKVAAQKVAR